MNGHANITSTVMNANVMWGQKYSRRRRARDVRRAAERADRACARENRAEPAISG